VITTKFSTMSNPFKKIAKNAESNKSEKQWKGAKNSSNVESRTCEQCGAPRVKNTNLTTCDYCGFKFMDIDSTIKSDN